MEIRDDRADKPDKVIAQSSFTFSRVTSTYTKVAAKFIGCPYPKAGTQYWIVVYIQDEGTKVPYQGHDRQITGGFFLVPNGPSGNVWTPGPAFPMTLVAEVGEGGCCPQNGK